MREIGRKLGTEPAVVVVVGVVEWKEGEVWGEGGFGFVFLAQAGR